MRTVDARRSPCNYLPINPQPILYLDINRGRAERITAHLELVPRSLGEFEMCPDWVPAMDSCQQLAWVTLKTMPVHGFDHRANWPAKVRNASRLGSQPFASTIYKSSAVFLYRFCTGAHSPPWREPAELIELPRPSLWGMDSKFGICRWLSSSDYAAIC